MGLFGVSDIAARLPFVLLALISAWLVYEIGSLILSRRAGAMASLILGTSYLWAAYSRRVSLIWRPSVFSWEASCCWCKSWPNLHDLQGNVVAGASGLRALCSHLTIVLRSVLAFLPLVGLMPWLGLACGALPTLIWVWKSIAAYGIIYVGAIFAGFPALVALAPFCRHQPRPMG